jgi:hypothetical protein
VTAHYIDPYNQTSAINMTMLDKLLFSKTAKTSKDKAEQASPRHIEVLRRTSKYIATKPFASSPGMSDSEQQGQVSRAGVALPKRQQACVGVIAGS